MSDGNYSVDPQTVQTWTAQVPLHADFSLDIYAIVTQILE